MKSSINSGIHKRNFRYLKQILCEANVNMKFIDMETYDLYTV